MNERQNLDHEQLTCPSCGTDVSEHDASCGVCGQQFFSCPECNALISGAETSCPGCGITLIPVDFDDMAEMDESDILDDIEELEAVSELEEDVTLSEVAEIRDMDVQDGDLEILRDIEAISDIGDMAEEVPELEAEPVEMRGAEPGFKEDPYKEVRRKFYQPQIDYIPSFMVLLLFLASIGFILEFTLLKNFWYDNFNLYNGFLMIVTAVGVIIAMTIIMTSRPEAPAMIHESDRKLPIAIAGGALALTSFSFMAIFGKDLGPWNVLLNLFLIYGILGVVQISPTLPKDEVAKLGITFTGLFLILLVPVHEALGPYQTDFTSLPWNIGNELLFVFGITLVAAGFASLRINTSFLAIWLFGALVLFLVPFHEMAGIVPSSSYEPWDHMLVMIGIVTSAAGSIGFLAKKSQYDSMARHIENGNGYFESGAYEKALEEYRVSHNISIRSGVAMHYATPWYSMADALARMGKPEDALPIYEVALSINDDDEIVWVNKANCLGQLNKYTDALVCYERALEINPYYVDGWFSKASLEKGLGKLEMAEESYTKALDIYSDYGEAWLSLGQVQSDQGSFADAHKSLDEGRELEPGEMKFRLEKARVFRKEGKPEDAIQWLESVLEFEPDFKPAIIELADLLYEQEDHHEALELLYTIPAEKRKDLASRILEVKMLIKLKTWDRAGSLLGDAVRRHGKKNELLFLISLANELKLEELEDQKYTEEIRGLDIDKAVREFYLGEEESMKVVISYLNDNVEEFSRLFLERELFTDLEHREYLEGQIEGPSQEFGDLNVIPALVRIYSEITPLRKEAVYDYRRAAMSATGIAEFNSLPKALEFYENVIMNDDMLLEAYKGRSEVFLSLKRFMSVINTCDMGLDKYPGDVELWNMKGEAYLKLRNYPKALKCFEECISLDPSYVRAWLNKGNTYVKLNKLETAVKCYGAVLQIDPNHLPAVRNRNICRKSFINRRNLELMEREFIIDEAEEYDVEEEVIEETILEERTMDEVGNIIDESRMVIGRPVEERDDER